MAALMPQQITTQSQISGSKKQSSEPSATTKFPARLRKMLYDADENDFSDIVSWNRDGLSFRVHSPMVFTEKIMPAYFNQTKYKSFQRQLNLYDFVRIHQGYDKASYVNKNFRRDDHSLSLVLRNKVIRGNPKNTPATNCIHAAGHSNSLSMSAFDVQQALLDFEEEAEPNSLVCWDMANSSISDTFLEPAFDEPCLSENQLVEDSVFDTDDNIDFYAADDVPNDFSNDPLFQSMMNDPILLSFERDKAVSELIIDNEVSTSQTEHSFPWKLHDLLEETESNNFSHIVSWEPDGVSFKVHKIDEFVTKIMPLYFDQNKYDSFRRILNLYSFSRVKQEERGSNSGVYFHPSLVKGDRSLCKEIKRQH
jgi:hypothetical protein